MMEWLLPGVAATSSPRGPLLVPPLLFSKGKETGCHPQIPFPVRRPDTGYGIPAPPLRGTGLLVRATLISGERGNGAGKQEIRLP
jgi:hypothetical protein